MTCETSKSPWISDPTAERTASWSNATKDFESDMPDIEAMVASMPSESSEAATITMHTAVTFARPRHMHHEMPAAQTNTGTSERANMKSQAHAAAKTSTHTPRPAQRPLPFFASRSSRIP